jgi:hypothetical protein
MNWTPIIAAVFHDPATGTELTGAVTLIGAIISAFTSPVHKAIKGE